MKTEKPDMIIDAKNATLGRLASYAAKQSLLGKSIVIVNCDEIVITGRKKKTIEDYYDLRQKGGHGLKGPKILKSPYRILKRTIRGMLSHRQQRGKDALSRIICHNDVPEEFKDAKMISSGKEKPTKKITLKGLSKEI